MGKRVRGGGGGGGAAREGICVGDCRERVGRKGMGLWGKG